MTAFLEALHHNVRLEVLYLFACKGLNDTTLPLLTEVLRNGRIWSANFGEDSVKGRAAWWAFADALKDSNLAYTYISDTPGSLQRGNETLKHAITANIRVNRAHAPPRCDAILRCVKLNWFNPAVEEPSKGSHRLPDETLRVVRVRRLRELEFSKQSRREKCNVVSSAQVCAPKVKPAAQASPARSECSTMLQSEHRFEVPGAGSKGVAKTKGTGRQHICNMCHLSCTRKCSLVRHLKKKHS